MDYAEGGQLIDWNEDDNRFYLRHEYQENFLSETYLRTLFRDIVKGLYYRNFKHFQIFLFLFYYLMFKMYFYL